MRIPRYFCILLFFSLAFSACQKDQSVEVNAGQSVVAVKADTSNNSGNFLAVKGDLQVTVGDSTYTFDAAKDSIAFINVNIDSNRYYGITAINKQHSVSFGISSPGLASPDRTNTVAGCQLLFSADTNPNRVYTLGKSSVPGDTSQLNLVSYRQDSVLAKGTFTTVLVSKDGKQKPVPVKGKFRIFSK
jgi:hypothetical protein